MKKKIKIKLIDPVKLTNNKKDKLIIKSKSNIYEQKNGKLSLKLVQSFKKDNHEKINYLFYLKEIKPI